MAAKRARDECYYCTEKFVPGHKCGGKGVFLLELDDDQDIEEVAEELGISLHALTALASPTRCNSESTLPARH